MANTFVTVDLEHIQQDRYEFSIHDGGMVIVDLSEYRSVNKNARNAIHLLIVDQAGYELYKQIYPEQKQGDNNVDNVRG